VSEGGREEGRKEGRRAGGRSRGKRRVGWRKVGEGRREEKERAHASIHGMEGVWKAFTEYKSVEQQAIKRL
jgi:hypothetical protein